MGLECTNCLEVARAGSQSTLTGPDNLIVIDGSLDFDTFVVNFDNLIGQARAKAPMAVVL